MARYNEILVGRFARAVQKLFSMKGEVPIGSLAGELQVIHAFQSGAENRYLEGWNRYGQQFLSVAGVAAQNTAIRLRNPVGSNVIAVIEKIFLASATVADNALFIQHGAITTDYASPIGSTSSRLDARGNQQPTLLGSSTTNVGGAGGTMWQGNIAVSGAGSNVDVIVTDVQEVPLVAGDAISIVTTAVNIQFSATIWWRERFLEDSERT